MKKNKNIMMTLNIYPYEAINYKNNTILFFQGIYLSQKLSSFMPNYNNAALNKKNFIKNSNINNNKLEEKINEKNVGFHQQKNNNNGKILKQFTSPIPI